MSRGHCILSHGFESSPDANKVTALAEVAERCLRAVYHLIVVSDVNINTIYDEVDGADLCHLVSTPDSQISSQTMGKKQHNPVTCQRIKNSGEPENCLQGCSLLHLHVMLVIL